MDRAHRILVVPEWYPWRDEPGGGIWAHTQARAIARRHSVVVVACRGVSGSGAPRGFAVAEEQLDEVQVFRVLYRVGGSRRAAFVNRMRGMLAVQARLSERGFKADVVHAHVFSSGFPSLLLGRRAGAAVVVSEHYSGFPLGLLSSWDRTIARLTFHHADLVCPASKDLGRHLAQVAPRARLRTVVNPVDTDVFHPDRGLPPASVGTVRMLNVGALKDGKGHRFLLQALARASARRPFLRLTIVGHGPLRPELEAEAADLEIGALVTFAGRLAPAEVAEEMRRSDFLVLPSLWENAPVALSEALASGLPVVASRVGGIPELLPANAGRLVTPADVESLEAGIVSMADSYQDIDGASLAAATAARHGLDAVAERWGEAYEAALALSRSRRRRKRI